MKYYSYDEFVKDVHILINRCSIFEPEVIVGIARGGLTLAHSMAEGMDIREVETLRTELYDKSCKRDSISIFGECNLSKAKKVLIVDDIADSGETLDAIVKQLKYQHKDIEFLVATIFYKKTSIYQPDVWINEATELIEFFWEKDFK